MYAYYREIFPVAMKLVEIFGVALGVDRRCHENDENENGGDGGLEKDFQWPIWGMRALHYPPPPPPSCAEEEEKGGEGEDGDGDEERMGLGAHKDFSWVTLVLQDEVGGLEVLNSEGKWIDVPPREGTLVVNVGQVSFFFPFLYSRFFYFSLFFHFSFCLFPQPNLKSQISQHPYAPIHNKLILPPPSSSSPFSTSNTKPTPSSPQPSIASATNPAKNKKEDIPFPSFSVPTLKPHSKFFPTV